MQLSINMNKLYTFIGFLGFFLFLSSCADRKLSTNNNADQKELSHLQQMMTGTFSSAAEAKSDSLFFDINLVMFPIWENDPNSKWLYVEQAATKYLDKPYR